MSLAVLSIDLVAKVAEFEKDLGQAARASEKAGAQIARAVSTSIAGLSVAASVAAASLVAATKSSADYADGLGKMAQRSGVAVEALSGLAYAAELADVSREDLAKGLKALNIEIDKGGDKLLALGVKSKTADGAMLELADVFAKMPDGAQKSALAAELFGDKFGPQLITLLNQGAAGIKAATDEAQRFGLIVSKEAAEAAEKFNDNLTRLEKSAQGAKAALTSDLIKGLGDATEAFLKANAEGSKFQGILAAIQTLLTGDDRHKANVEMVETADRMLEIQNAMDKIKSKGANQTGQDAAALSNLQKELGLLQARYNTAKNYAELLDNENKKPERKERERQEDVAKRVGPDLAAQGAKLALSLTAQDAGLSGDFLEKWDKLSAAYKGNHISLSLLTEAQKILLKQQPFMKEAVYSGDVSDALSRRLDSTERARKATEQLNAELDQLSGRTGADKKRDLTSALEGRLNAGEVFSKEELDRIVNGIGGVTAATDEAAKATVNYADVFESSFEAAIVKGGKLKDVLKGLAQDLATLYLRENVTKPLAKAASGGFESLLKGAGGAIAGAFGGGSVNTGTATGANLDLFYSAGGNVMTGKGPLALRKYANGGVATSPQLSVFGEGSMAEAYVPLPDGRRIPVAMKGGGGAPITIVNQLTVGDVASSAMVQDQLRASEARMAASLHRAQRYGRG